MQYIAIKKEYQNNKEIYIINAIPLKNSNKTVIQKIPHPLGTDSLEFTTLEEAQKAITIAGFSFILPNGSKGTLSKQKPPSKGNVGQNYEQIFLNAVKDKIESQNSNVVASAVLALAEVPSEENFDILFNKLGEDNDIIRKNAISGICRYANILSDRIIEALNSQNWVTRNSALTCITNITETNSDDLEKYIIPLANTCNDKNAIVQANAISTFAKLYQQYLKNKKV